MFSRGIVAAMEDEAGAELAMDEAGADSMEADLVETVDMSADIDSGTNEIEQTVKDADQLERHVEVLTDSEGEGGAAPEVIEATEIAVEAICNRLGIYGGTGIPALESFSTRSGRARATRIAIETIGEKIKKIWEAVVNAFKKLINYVKDFFAKLFDANKKMLSRVIALRVKAKNIKGIAKDKISSSGITNVINETELDAFKIADIASSISMANNILQNTNELVGGVQNKASFDSAKLVLGGYAKGADAKASAPEKMAWKVAFEFAGNKVIHCVPKDSVVGKEAYDFAAKYSVNTEKNDKKSDGDIAPLDAGQIDKILNGVETTVKKLMDQKSAIASIQTNMDKVIHEIQKLASSGSKEDEDIGNRSTMARSAVTAIGNGSIKIVTYVGSEVTRSCQAYLTYAERSIGSYSEDNKKEEKK